MPLTGILAGPIAGLRFETPSCAGLTSATGEFSYRAGEQIAFLIGETPIGYAIAAPRLTLAHLISRVAGKIDRLLDPGLTNVARFLCSLDRDGNLDGGIEIPVGAHEVLGQRRINFRNDVSFGEHHPDNVRDFAEDAAVAQVMADLSAAGVFTAATPRALCSAATARNEVRRNLLGILRFRDVKVPLQDGSFVYADIFRPDKQGTFPVIMNCGVYGRAFHHYTICSEADFERHEAEEERYFQGNPDGLIYENHETVNTAEWVPNDYAVMRVDGPGTGRNPGKLAVWGLSTAEAFRDAIDWAGVQSWSNGNVGLWGMSYYAMTQHQAASLEPKHLKAMIAIGTDADMYEEVCYTGGILNDEFFPVWYAGGVRPAVCGEPDAVDFMPIMRAAAFKDSDPEAIFGPRSTVFMSPDMSKVTVPLWTVACTTHPAHFHQLGSSETYLATNTPDKKIDFWEDWFTRAYTRETVADHKAFFDHWLKGIDNGIMAKPGVRLDIRTGNGAGYVQEEHEWPVARTTYPRWHLDATPSPWPGDEHRQDFLTLASTRPTGAATASYSAEVPAASRGGPPPAMMAVLPPSAHLSWKTGVSFISEPVAEDMIFAGYAKAALWVSSSSSDIDLYLGLRVIDENGREVNYSGPTTMGLAVRNYPLSKGWLKVSHRKRDEARSTDYTVKHTHLKADYAPLTPGEIVPVEVEIVPTTARIRKGHRIRLDVQPHDGFDHGTRHAYVSSYHDGATNTLHTGPEYPSWIQLPIVPDRV